MWRYEGGGEWEFYVANVRSWAVSLHAEFWDGGGNIDDQICTSLLHIRAVSERLYADGGAGSVGIYSRYEPNKEACNVMYQSWF